MDMNRLVIIAALIMIAAVASLRYVRFGSGIVVLRMERPDRYRGPGLRLVVPLLERVERVSTEPRLLTEVVACYSADRVLVRVPVSLSYRIADGLRSAPLAAVVEDQLADALRDATNEVVTGALLTVTIGEPVRLRAMISDGVRGELARLGLELCSLSAGPVRVDGRVRDDLASEARAVLARPGRLVNAETRLLEIMTECRAVAAEHAINRSISDSNEAAAALYELRTRRVAASNGGLLMVVPPGLPPVPAIEVADRENITPIRRVRAAAEAT
jgi:regulator of protease activity HflC (stomatin/prohibitin superfamily)